MTNELEFKTIHSYGDNQELFLKSNLASEAPSWQLDKAHRKLPNLRQLMSHGIN
jgi:hypothetical protein